MIPIVVLKGSELNLTLSSLKFSYWGTSMQADIQIVDSWQEGLKYFKTGLVLFVNSGTVFSDLDSFLQKLNNYPHQGLIGHLVYKNDDFYLDDQCFLLDVTNFVEEDFLIEEHSMINCIASKQNIHHDYTPLWIKKGQGEKLQTKNLFGTKILDKQLRQGKLAVNFHQKLREFKKCLYNQKEKDDYLLTQKPYIEMCRKQLWLLNNESISIINCKNLIAPASGLFWIYNAALSQTPTLNLVDISSSQINLATRIWSDWDGENYGNFVANNIDSTLNFQLDDPTLSQLDLLRLKRKDRLAFYLQEKFNKICPVVDFKYFWQKAKNEKQINFENNDLLHYIKGPITKDTSVWKSNVENFKYTMLMHDYNKVKEFLNWIDPV